MARGLGEIFEEARRRRVFQTTGVYIAAVWGLSQGAVQVAPALDLSPSIVRWILMGGIVLLPVVLLAWKFDVSREGIVLDPGHQPTLGVSDFDTLATMPTAMGGRRRGRGARSPLGRRGWSGCGAVSRRVLHRARGRLPRALLRSAGLAPTRPGLSRSGHLDDRRSRQSQWDAARRQALAAPAPLSFASVLRVNEAGPLLRLEHVAAGAPFHAAQMQFRDSPRVAQIRASARKPELPRGGGPIRS